MSLVVETGSGSATAESYISLANADLYFAAHGSPAEWTGLTDAAKESALRYAAAWMDEHYRWLGVISYPSTPQKLDWPRAGVVDNEGRVIASDSIPQAIKDLQCEAALRHIKFAVNKSFERGGQIQSRSAQGASISYFGSASVTPADPYLDSLAAPYVAASGNVLLRC
jgi:hypothetical protein